MAGSGAVIVAARRTPLARLDGALAGLDADGLASTVIRAVIADGGIAGDTIDDVIMATAAGPGGNIARRALLDAGVPPSVPGLTIDRQCGGGLDAIVLACRLVESGAGEIYVAGGVESASTSPLRGAAAPDEMAGGRRFFPRRMFAGGGHDDPGMAESAEIVASELGLSRDRQDRCAAASHARAVAARAAGIFTREIVACTDPDGQPVTVDTCPRPTLTVERLTRFPAIVRTGGTVTAGNASQIADGAAAALVVSPRVAAGLGRAGLVHRGSRTVGVDPRLCGLGAVDAVRRLVDETPELVLGEVAHVAFTEAFAAQVVATTDELGFDDAIVNPHGGAIALGHPWAASGAVQVVRLFHALPADHGSGLALAAIAGGMGTAAWFTSRST